MRFKRILALMKKREQGQALVEFSLILPVFLAVFFATVLTIITAMDLLKAETLSARMIAFTAQNFDGSMSVTCSHEQEGCSPLSPFIESYSVSCEPVNQNIYEIVDDERLDVPYECVSIMHITRVPFLADNQKTIKKVVTIR